MDDTNVADGPDAVRRFGSKEAEELVLRTVAAHADSLLRTARRHSLCHDDAQDAYQRALEIFMRHAERLDPGRAAAWLHTVCKHEAMAVRKGRQRLVGAQDVDLDAHEAHRLPSADERLLGMDMVNRSAEALQRLKPQELRALWLKAQGLSYSDIAETTGWTYTKVNRCLTEGRRSFLERYAGIESGAECERWAPTLSALVDGEATREALIELRPHLRNCPGCRTSLKALRASRGPLGAVLPVPLLGVAASDGGEMAGGLLLRVYEAVVGGVQEKVAGSALKVQAALEASAAGKVAAVAASAAAVAGGGYATVGGATEPVTPARAPARVAERSPDPAPAPAVTAPTPAATRAPVPSPSDPQPSREPSGTNAGADAGDEFFAGPGDPAVEAVAEPASRPSPAPSPEFDVESGAGAPAPSGAQSEFGG